MDAERRLAPRLDLFRFGLRQAEAAKLGDFTGLLT